MSRDILSPFVGRWVLSRIVATQQVPAACENRSLLVGFQQLLSKGPISLVLELRQGSIDWYLSGTLTLADGKTLGVYASTETLDPPAVDGFFADEVYFRAVAGSGEITIQIDGTPPDSGDRQVIIQTCLFTPATSPRRDRRTGPARSFVSTRPASGQVRQVHDAAPDLYRQCGQCSGSGQVDCSACGGMGGRSESRVDYDWDNNPVFNTEWVACTACAGGRSTCPTCGGSGSVSR